MKTKRIFQFSMAVASLSAAFAGLALASGQGRPNTGADNAVGADPRSNVGSPVFDPATTPAPSAQRQPARQTVPEARGERERDDTEIQGELEQHPLPARDDVNRAEDATSDVGTATPVDRGAASEERATPGSEEWRRERE